MIMMSEKTDLRRKAEALRKTLARPDHADDLARHANSLGLEPGAVVAGYCAFRDEADPRALMLALAGVGHPLALPAIVAKGQPLRFHRWCEGDEMCVHGYGVSEPLSTCEIAVPSVLLVPLLAFDRHGVRLGYGGGFYDRTLEQLRAQGPVTAIGIAYAGQEVETLPRGEHDQPLDAVLIEDGLIRF
jgi:5-formyltetrahydrofolate cyclo-ligase